jgi:hypothetical protein
MRQRARTDLCGGRSVMVVPTATLTRRNSQFVRIERPTLRHGGARRSLPILWRFGAGCRKAVSREHTKTF